MSEKIKENIVNKNGLIIIIEDDADDQEFLTEVFQKLTYGNKIIFFFDGQEALEHIYESDVPKMILFIVTYS